jgi:hypothetical protein
MPGFFSWEGMHMPTYSVIDGNGGMLRYGLQERAAREAAQREANSRLESVWLTTEIIPDEKDPVVQAKRALRAWDPADAEFHEISAIFTAIFGRAPTDEDAPEWIRTAPIGTAEALRLKGILY